MSSTGGDPSRPGLLVALSGAGLGTGWEAAAIVVQHDRFNRSAINTVVVAAITSNLRFAAMPGNVRLAKGEANLARPSVVNVSLLWTVDRRRLTELVGKLSPARVSQITAGLGLVLGIESEP